MTKTRESFFVAALREVFVAHGYAFHTVEEIPDAGWARVEYDNALVMVLRSLPESYQVIALLHELGHVWMHRGENGANYDLRRMRMREFEAELFANALASRFNVGDRRLCLSHLAELAEQSGRAVVAMVNDAAKVVSPVYASAINELTSHLTEGAKIACVVIDEAYNITEQTVQALERRGDLRPSSCEGLALWQDLCYNSFEQETSSKWI